MNDQTHYHHAQQWQAAEPLSPLQPLGAAKALTVHHTSTIPDQGSAGGDVRWIQAFHQRSGWIDIGYHYIVARAEHMLNRPDKIIIQGRGFLADWLWENTYGVTIQATSVLPLLLNTSLV